MRTLRRPNRRWDDVIMQLRGIGVGDVDRIPIRLSSTGRSGLFYFSINT